MKVFGVGMNKTGTTTLGVCLSTLGYTHTSYNLEMLRHVRRGELEDVMAFVRGFDAFEDWPWPLIYRELDEAFPGSRFILTTRTDVDRWFDSLSRHADRTGPTEMRELVYGHSMPRDHPDAHRSMYLAHNEAVRSYFRDRPDDFLEVCWEKGDGWAELCRFLNKPTPDIPFPHANQRPVTGIRRLVRRLTGERPRPHGRDDS